MPSIYDPSPIRLKTLKVRYDLKAELKKHSTFIQDIFKHLEIEDINVTQYSGTRSYNVTFTFNYVDKEGNSELSSRIFNCSYYDEILIHVINNCNYTTNKPVVVEVTSGKYAGSIFNMYNTENKKCTLLVATLLLDDYDWKTFFHKNIKIYTGSITPPHVVVSNPKPIQDKFGQSISIGDLVLSNFTKLGTVKKIDINEGMILVDHLDDENVGRANQFILVNDKLKDNLSNLFLEKKLSSGT